MGLELPYFDSLLISLVASTPAPSRPQLSLAARDIFLKCKCDLATSPLRFTFFSGTGCRLEQVPAGPRQPLRPPALCPSLQGNAQPPLLGVGSAFPHPSAKSSCPDTSPQLGTSLVSLRATASLTPRSLPPWQCSHLYELCYTDNRHS